MPFQAFAGMVLLACATLLSGCADMSDGMTSAFADPARYNLYNCKQLETERKTLSTRMVELQGLMAKAQDGFAGPAVAELAYRNDYIAIRGQKKNADEAWALNKCVESPPAKTAEMPSAAPAPASKSGHSQKSGSAVY
ncbi:MAG: twin-arginine translocation pathway signal [Bradyrhizobium sp.]|jgi:hypothetical protein